MNRIDLSGLTVILPNGKEATSIDRQLLDLKKQWQDNLSQRKDIAKQADDLRKNNHGGWSVSSDKTLGYYVNSGGKNPSTNKVSTTKEEHWGRNELNVLPSDEKSFYTKYWNMPDNQRASIIQLE